MSGLELVDADQVAAMLGPHVSRRMVYRLVELHNFPAMRLGRRYLFSPSAVAAWVEQQATTPANHAA